MYWLLLLLLLVVFGSSMENLLEIQLEEWEWDSTHKILHAPSIRRSFHSQQLSVYLDLALKALPEWVIVDRLRLHSPLLYVFWHLRQRHCLNTPWLSTHYSITIAWSTNSINQNLTLYPIFNRIISRSPLVKTRLIQDYSPNYGKFNSKLIIAMCLFRSKVRSKLSIRGNI